jgi:hypothetical protein
MRVRVALGLPTAAGEVLGYTGQCVPPNFAPAPEPPASPPFGGFGGLPGF